VWGRGRRPAGSTFSRANGGRRVSQSTSAFFSVLCNSGRVFGKGLMLAGSFAHSGKSPSPAG
jgi:hypothetical protein